MAQSEQTESDGGRTSRGIESGRSLDSHPTSFSLSIERKMWDERVNEKKSENKSNREVQGESDKTRDGRGYKI
ncbi:hypothetical protein EVAR_89625_1 [Eumeta japonica]|uniref:Uncharacterized protein n=1 Tax=Eumeta variegata TaxID=151549 RepID=A0A4C1Z9M0_EUMVA|nr:hypothetical protein EVAR_89625_1 [Eumeta japonica]